MESADHRANPLLDGSRHPGPRAKAWRGWEKNRVKPCSGPFRPLTTRSVRFAPDHKPLALRLRAVHPRLLDKRLVVREGERRRRCAEVFDALEENLCAIAADRCEHFAATKLLAGTIALNAFRNVSVSTSLKFSI